MKTPKTPVWSWKTRWDANQLQLVLMFNISICQYLSNDDELWFLKVLFFFLHFRHLPACGSQLVTWLTPHRGNQANVQTCPAINKTCGDLWRKALKSRGTPASGTWTTFMFSSALCQVWACRLLYPIASAGCFSFHRICIVHQLCKIVFWGKKKKKEWQNNLLAFIALTPVSKSVFLNSNYKGTKMTTFCCYIFINSTLQEILWKPVITLKISFLQLDERKKKFTLHFQRQIKMSCTSKIMLVCLQKGRVGTLEGFSAC